jgi:O-antigen ligase
MDPETTHAMYRDTASQGNVLIALLALVLGVVVGGVVLANPTWVLVPAVVLLGLASFFYRHPLAGLVLVTATVPILYRISFTDFGASLPDLDYTRTVVFGLFAVVVLRTLQKGKTPSIDRYDVILFLWLGVGLMSLARAREIRSDAVEFLSIDVLPILLYVAARAILTTRASLRVWFLSLSISGVLISAILLLEFALRTHLFVAVPAYDVVFRSHGPFGEPNQAGMYLALCLGPAVFMLLEEQRSDRRLWLRLLVVVIVAGLVVTFSRRGWVAALIVVGILFSTRTRRRWMYALGGAGLLLLVVAAPRIEESSFVQGRLLAEGSLRSRRAFFEASMRMASDGALFGLGYNAPRHVYSRYGIPENVWVPKTEARGWKTGGWSPHNTFMTALIEGGIVRLACLLLILFGLLPRLRAAVRQSEAEPVHSTFARNLHLLFIGMVLSLTVAGLVGDVLRNTIVLSTFLVLAAAVTNRVQEPEDQEASLVSGGRHSSVTPRLSPSSA